MNVTVHARVCGPNLTSGRHPNRINNNSEVPLEKIMFDNKLNMFVS